MEESRGHGGAYTRRMAVALNARTTAVPARSPISSAEVVVTEAMSGRPTSRWTRVTGPARSSRTTTPALWFRAESRVHRPLPVGDHIEGEVFRLEERAEGGCLIEVAPLDQAGDHIARAH